MKKSILATLLAVGLSAFTSLSARSILDIKQSITDDNIIAPESFETQTRQLEENFYIKNYVVPGMDLGGEQSATPAEYEERLKVLPTEIELPYNSLVGNFINMYLTKKRALVADMLALHSYYGPSSTRSFSRRDADRASIPPRHRVGHQPQRRLAGRSRGPVAVHARHGQGARHGGELARRRAPRPRLSSRNAARYLKQLHDIYDDWSLAIAAYNCGPGNVNKALRRAGEGKKDFWEIYEFLPAETRGYVPAFIAANYVMNYYRNHGITPTIVKRQLTTDTVTVNKYVHFNQIAAVLNIPVEEIRMLNPQFLKDIIPGDYRPYKLTLPTQQCLSYVMSEKRILDYDSELYARRTHVEPGLQPAEPVLAVSDNGVANLASVSQQTVNADVNNELAQTQAVERMTVKTHVVERGESIRDIARKYGVSATDIKRWNHLRRGKVKEGDQLKIEVFERVSPDNIKVVAASEVAQVSPQELREAVKSDAGDTSRSVSAPAPAAASAKARTAAAPAKKTPAKAAAPKTTTHKVRKGETLSKIASKYGTTIAAIQTANGMGKSTNIQIGQSIKIPAKQAAKKTSKRSRRRR